MWRGRPHPAVETSPIRPSSRFLVFGAPELDEAERREVLSCFDSGWLGSGPRVARFEEAFAKYKGGVSQAVAVSSCSAALHLSLVVVGFEPGDEIIAPALTFGPTINAMMHAGATPVLADVDPVTFNIDPRDVEARITPRTRALLAVHFAGRPCAMDALMAIAVRHQLMVVEDCAHAIETEYQGRPAGTIGDFGCFSFYVTKNVTTGEGGMVLTARAEDAARIRTLARNGMSHDAWQRFADPGRNHYVVVDAGYKYNMMDLQAAIGIHQLARVDASWRRRAEIWQRYNRAFADLPLVLPADPAAGTRHAHHLYTVLIDERECGLGRDDFLAAMAAQHIGTGVHYLSIPEHPFYRESFGWQPTDYPHAMRIGRQTASLPLSSKLTDDDVEDVIRAVRRVLRRQ